MRILESPLIILSIERLGVGYPPLANFILVNPNISILNPTLELWECFRIVVLTDAAIDSIVPTVNATNYVVAINETI